jgi:hypothetical protein
MLALASYVVVHEDSMGLDESERAELFARFGGNYSGWKVREKLMPLIRSIARSQP